MFRRRHVSGSKPLHSSLAAFERFLEARQPRFGVERIILHVFEGLALGLRHFDVADRVKGCMLMFSALLYWSIEFYSFYLSESIFLWDLRGKADSGIVKVDALTRILFMKIVYRLTPFHSATGI